VNFLDFGETKVASEAVQTPFSKLVRINITLQRKVNK